MFKEFHEIAKAEATQIDEVRRALYDEEYRIRQRLDEIANELSGMVEGEKRLAAYITASAANRYLCPACFMRSEASVEMKPIPSDNESDVFKCPKCHEEIETES